MTGLGWFASVVFFAVLFGGLTLIINLVAWAGTGRFLRVFATVMTPILVGIAVAMPFFIDNQLDQDKQCADAGGVRVHSRCLDRSIVKEVG